MSERDTSGTSGRDTPAPGGATPYDGAMSPYDEPTGQIPVPGSRPEGPGTRAAGTRAPGTRAPEPRAAGPGGGAPVPPSAPTTPDRDDFYNRHARRTPAPYSRVDDLDDLDPGDVETRSIPGAASQDPAAAAPATRDPATKDPAATGAATEDAATVQFAKSPSATPVPEPVDDAVTTPEPALPPVGTARYDFLDDEDSSAGAYPRREASDTAVAVDEEEDGRTRRFGRRRKDAVENRNTTPADDDLSDALAKSRRGTIDLGLLVLRVALGLVVGAHGLQKLFGLWNGPRLSGFESMLVDGGFNADYAQVLAIVGALSETIGGLMVILGLLTPIGASAILGTMLVAAAYKISAAGGFAFFAAAGGVEFELFLAVAAAVVILTGPGLYSLDYPRGWARRPFVGSFLWLIVGAAAAVAVWVLANGSNPLA
ncbi:DoxX family protein [Gordonia sp. 'Campus']|uniref:DoxX family protein n=1 Tax=Gordonia sp. 'Campus' TaxID=2915824 RepID=UPI001EE4B1FD|nr:DoxX family protein [Gordonia sp. 'Campus']